MKTRKGYAVLMDSVVALTFALLILTSLVGMRQSDPSYSDMATKRLHYASEDALDVLNKEGVLDVIGEEWAAAQGNKSSPHFINASNISRAYFDQLLPPQIGYMLTIDDDIITNSTHVQQTDSSTLTHSTRLLVGYGSGLPTRGFVARAFLSNIREKETSSYTYFGGYVGQGNITVSVRDIPADAQIRSCCLELNARPKFQLSINGIPSGTFDPSASADDMSANLLDKSTPGCIEPGATGTGCVLNASLASIVPGSDNTFQIDFTEGTINDHYIGGGYIHITYTTTEMDTDKATQTTRYYFPGIDGMINLYDSFYVPGLLSSMSANLHYKANYTVFLNIGDTTVFNSTWNETDQTVAITTAQMAGKGLIYQPAGDPKSLSLNTVPVRFGTGNLSQSSVLDIILLNDRSGSMRQSGWTLTSNVPKNVSWENVVVPSGGYSPVLTFSVPSGVQRLAVAINWSNVPGYNGSEGSEFVLNIRRPAGTWLFAYPGAPGGAGNVVDPPDSVGNANEYYSGISTKPQVIYVENPTAGSWAVSVYGHNLRPTTGPPPSQNVSIAVYQGGAADLVRNPTILSIDAAKSASKNFVDSMMPTDRGAYMAFGSYPVLLQGLTFSKANLKTAIDGTGLEGGTYIHYGIGNATNHLISSGRPNATKILILLTDGQNDRGPQVVLDIANRSKSQGVTIFTIGMTNYANMDLLSQVASSPSYSYFTPDGSGLQNIYDQIFNILSSFFRQSVNITGSTSVSQLYPDSYLEFTYEPINQSTFGEVSFKGSTCRFNDTVGCQGVISVPTGLVVADAKVTSYSGNYWTDYVHTVNSAGSHDVYQLSDWHSGGYGDLGDPFMVYIPADYVLSGGNTTVTVGVGYNGTTGSGCSLDDRAIYTLRMHTVVGYGDVFDKNLGCRWNLEFEDGSSFVTPLPTAYNGTDQCYYTHTSISYDKDDAAKDAVFRLMSQLDLDKDGRIDLLFDTSMINVELGQASDIQSLWGPAKFKLIVWM
jgi:hypothetical protein